MDLKKTDMKFLYDDLVKKYGEEKGDKLYILICKKYANLCDKENESKNEEMNKHIFKRLLPAISMYLTMVENGFGREESFEVINNEIQKDAKIKAKVNNKLTKMIFTYTLFKMFAKAHMKKNYPKEGFNVKWQRRDNEEVHFNIHRCIYKDMCDKFGCPKLCTVFCNSDITAFAGYKPKILFKRFKTIAEDSDYCDFHFINNK